MSDTKVTQLAPNAFKLAINGIAYNIHRVSPEIDTPIDAILDRHYWAHVSMKMTIGDIIQVIPEDNAYFAELIVKDTGRLYAVVSLLRFVELNKKQTEDVPEGYEVRWRGRFAKFGVLKGKDLLKDGFLERTEAEDWIKEMLKVA